MSLPNLAIALALAASRAQAFADAAAPRRWGTQAKRVRAGSKNGFGAAKKRRNRIRNRIAARSRAANR